MVGLVIAAAVVSFFLGRFTVTRKRSDELDLCRAVVSIQAEEIEQKNWMLTAHGPWRAL